MKRLFLILSACWAMLTTISAQKIQFHLQDSLSNKQLQTKVEQSLSLLLTEINAADKENRPLQLSDDYMTDEARESLCNLWDKYAHFTCEDSLIVSKLNKTTTFYQTHEIYVTLHPHNTSDTTNVYRDLLVDMDYSGKIVGACFAFEGDIDYSDSRPDILPKLANDMRYLLSKYIECYEMKDETTLTSIFQLSGMHLTPNFHFAEDMKKHEQPGYESFAASIQKLFNENKPVEIKLEQISLTFSPQKAEFFGLTFHQSVHAGNQKCDGYVFMLIEKREGREAYFHFRTWQPDSPDGTPFPAEEVYNIHDFFLP